NESKFSKSEERTSPSTPSNRPRLPQSPQSQEEFDASPEYHELLVTYTNSLTTAIPGATVQWRRDGKIQYIDFPSTYEETTASLVKAGYFTGVTNYAFNPIGHPGGKEF